MKLIVLFVLASYAALSAQGSEMVFVSRDVYLMGTRAQLATYAVT